MNPLAFTECPRGMPTRAVSKHAKNSYSRGLRGAESKCNKFAARPQKAGRLRRHVPPTWLFQAPPWLLLAPLPGDGVLPGARRSQEEPGGTRRSQAGAKRMHVARLKRQYPAPALALPGFSKQPPGSSRQGGARQVQVACLKWQYPPPFPGPHWLLQAPPGFSWFLSLGKGCCQEPGEARGEALSLTPSSACATDSTNCYHECGSCCFHCAFNFPSTGATGRSSSINTTLLLFLLLLLLLLLVLLLLPLLLLDFYCCYNFCSLLVPCRTGCMRGGCENKLARSW